jgi:WS/DGAT/MGAT family acyltransferase
MVDRLSALDASFLQVEEPDYRMHLLGVFVFEGTAPSRDEFADAVARGMPSVPRLRQRVIKDPLGIGRPVWADDTAFELRNHLRHATVRAPGDRAQLRSLAAGALARPLDMDRPAWELTLVEGLADRRFAVIGKFHHCMVDGVSAFDAAAGLFTTDPDGPLPPVETWRSRPQPTPLRLTAEAATSAMLNPLAAIVAARSRLRDPARLAGGVVTEVTALARLARLAGRAPRTALNRGGAGSDRDVAWLSVGLGELRDIKTAFETTINNVVLAVVAGALGRWLADRGEHPDELRALVPMSVRLTDERGVLGNRIASLYPRLPLDCEDPRERVARVVAEVSAVRRSGQAAAATALAEIGEFAPPAIMARAARLHYRGRLFNLGITNIPGPRVPLYLCGRQMLDVLPAAPVTRDQGLSVAVVSYLDRLVFALSADRARIEDLDALAEALRVSYEETRAAAGVARCATRTTVGSAEVRSAPAQRARERDAGPMKEAGV